jgi:arabinofuranosyltransferase
MSAPTATATHRSPRRIRGALKDLLDDTSGPLDVGGFLSNLTSSLDRTTLVVPRNPFVAERKFCGS